MACRGSFIVLLLVGALLTQRIAAQRGCHKACSSNDDCLGALACMKGVCNDDPGVDTHICAGGATCQPYGSLVAPTNMPSKCNTGEMSECCKPGQRYDLYKCSPPITSPSTKGTLTLNGFGEGGSGGGAASCTGKFYPSPSAKVVALSTGWFANRARCGKTIRIYGNGRSTTATVVDECDTRAGCDADHAYQPPCPLLDDVDASAAVWSALGVSPSDDRYGMMDITWSQLD